MRSAAGIPHLPAQAVASGQGGGGCQKVHSVSSGDVLAMQPQNRPPWFPQSIERLTRLAQTSPAAKAFLAKSQDDLGKLLPAQYDGIKAAVQ